MAKLLEKFDLRSNGDKASYPWGEWTDGKIRELKQGDTYGVSSSRPGTLR